MEVNRAIGGQILGYIAMRDQRLMQRCNSWLAPRWVRRWMLWATWGGDGWLWLAIGAAVLMLGGDERIPAVGASIAAAAAGVAVFRVIKKVANRPRPCAIAPHAWSTLLPPDRFSFPSGHTMTAFAVVTPLMMAYPELAPGLVFCAASVAASRVVLGMHYLSDVVAGAVLGGALGYLSSTIIQSLT